MESADGGRNDGGRATAKLGLSSNECFELDRDLDNDTSNAAAAGESTMNRTVIACQEAYVSGTADNLVNGDTGLAWIAGFGTFSYPFNTFNVVITDPANANVRVPSSRSCLRSVRVQSSTGMKL